MKQFLTLTLLILNSSIYSQEISIKDTIKLEILDEVKSTTYFNVGADLIGLNLTGTHVLFGSGLNFDVSNIAEKFSLSGNYFYHYAVRDFTSSGNNPVGNEVPNSISLLHFNVGYTISQKEKRKDESLTILKKGRTSYYSWADTKSIISNKIRLGFLSTSQVNSGETYAEITTAPNFTFSVEDYSIYSDLKCVEIGFAESKSTRSTFQVVNYGKRFNFEEKTRYIDLLIALPTKFPTISTLYQTEIEAVFSRLPVGLRLGSTRLSSNHLSKRVIWGSKIELGLNPGYHDGIMTMASLIYFKMGLTLNFFKEIK